MRWLLIAPLAVLAMAVAGSYAVWHFAVGQIEADYAAWVAVAAAQGWTVRAGPGERGGWPLAASLTLPDASMAGGAADVPGGIGWTAARVTLRVDLLSPNALFAQAEGAQSVTLGPGATLPFTADRFILSVPLVSGRVPDSAALDAAGLRFGAPVEGLTVGLLQGQFGWRLTAGSGDAAALVRLSAEAIALPPPPAPQAPLGAHIASATVEAELTGPVPAAATPAGNAAAWRDGGGKFLVRRIALGWGPLGVSGGATLALDEGLQPAGSASLRLVGYDDALAALVAGHALSAQAAKAAQAVLGLMALAPAGGAPGVEVPLTLQGGVLAMGHIPLAKVQKLSWPDAAGAASVPP
jgi:hypothetical protein